MRLWVWLGLLCGVVCGTQDSVAWLARIKTQEPASWFRWGCVAALRDQTPPKTEGVRACWDQALKAYPLHWEPGLISLDSWRQHFQTQCDLTWTRPRQRNALRSCHSYSQQLWHLSQNQSSTAVPVPDPEPDPEPKPSLPPYVRCQLRGSNWEECVGDSTHQTDAVSTLPCHGHWRVCLPSNNKIHHCACSHTFNVFNGIQPPSP